MLSTEMIKLAIHDGSGSESKLIFIPLDRVNEKNFSLLLVLTGRKSELFSLDMPGLVFRSGLSLVHQ